MTNTQNRNGRKPASARTDVRPGGYYSQDILQVPAELAKEIADLGLECRWVDAKEFVDSGNFHKHDWQPYKRAKTEETAAAKEYAIFKYGNDAEGYIRRKSLILAVRPISLGDSHRAFIQERSRRYHGDLKKRQVEQMREVARRSGASSSSVFEEDEDN
jgi:hypothetical protein